MTHRTRFLFVTVLASLITASAAQALIVLKFDTTIPGESTIPGHEQWIVIESLEFDVGRAISAAGGGFRETSNPVFSEIRLTKSMDVSSTELFMQAIAGKSLGKATIHFIQTGGTTAKSQVYYEVEAHEAIVSSYSASSGGERPSEVVSINFSKLCTTYTKYDGDKVIAGTPKCWDLEKNGSF